MENISYIDNIISHEKNIEQKHKRTILYVVSLLAGIALILMELNISTIKNSINLAPGFVFGGILLTIIGIIGIAKPKKAMFYKPTGEKLFRKEYYITPSHRDALYAAINNKSVDDLMKLVSSNISPIMVVIYITKSKSCAFIQIMEYVPHHYVPSMPTLSFIK